MRVFHSLSPATNKRFFYALDTVPGIIAPGVGLVTLVGQQPIAVEPQTVFRTPATATLTWNGLAFAAPGTVIPAQAALSIGGLAPGEVRQLTIIPSLPAPIENPPAAFAPTLIPIWTTNPGVGQITLGTLEINVTQGGNIGFVSPGRAQISIGSLAFTLTYGDTAVGFVQVAGLAPTLVLSTTITPDVGQVMTSQIGPMLSLPFTWIDDDPAPPSTWIRDAAA